MKKVGILSKERSCFERKFTLDEKSLRSDNKLAVLGFQRIFQEKITNDGYLFSRNELRNSATLINTTQKRSIIWMVEIES